MAQLVKGCFASEETLQIEAIERMKKFAEEMFIHLLFIFLKFF